MQIAPANTLAIAFLDASAAQQPGGLDALIEREEDALLTAPKSYAAHLRLGFSYLFGSIAGGNRLLDAREEFAAALALDREKAAAHVGLGIMRFNERSANRSKTELLQALRANPSDVLAREYLGQLYQGDLRDPRRGLAYMIDVPNLVPQYADILFHIGSVLHDLAQPELALHYLQQGIALDVHHVGEAGQHGYTLMARIYIEQHRLADATSVLNAAVAERVDVVYAKTLLGKIKGGDYSATPSPAPSKV
ncbi:MAG: hypothetical protein M3R53_00280 [Candidatus Eremiobacteraeota bacterium]|nr:hypothetical protein [Candidatus Eremiobacteraeota bacterium]